MKYLIGNRVINGDKIEQVLYHPAVKDHQSECWIEFDAASESYDAILKGDAADRFWSAYSGDAYDVMKAEATK